MAKAKREGPVWTDRQRRGASSVAVELKADLLCSRWRYPKRGGPGGLVPSKVYLNTETTAEHQDSGEPRGGTGVRQH